MQNTYIIMDKGIIKTVDNNIKCCVLSLQSDYKYLT